MITLTYEDKYCDTFDLTGQIIAAGYSTNRLLNVDCNGLTRTITIMVPDDLTPEEQTIIDNTVAAYDPLPIFKRNLIKRLNEMCQDYIYTHYDPPRQSSLNALLTEAVIMGYSNRIGYIGQALAWIKACITYYYSKQDEIEAVTSIEQLNRISWDYPGTFDASDPAITLREASNLTN